MDLTKKCTAEFFGTFVLVYVACGVAAATGGLVISAVGGSQPAMFLVAAAFLVIGSVCVRLIKK